MLTKQQQQDNDKALKEKLFLAKEKLLSNKDEPLSCVVLKKGEFVTSDAWGIKPLMVLLRVDKSCFEDCVVADKIVGKAAALMLVLGKAQAVYGAVMSQGGAQILLQNKIYYEYGELVEGIKNRDKTDLCPMEKTVLNIEDPALAFDALEKTIATLMAGKK